MPLNYQAPSGPASAYLHAASNFNPAAAADLIGREEALGMQQILQNQRLQFEGSQQSAIESARHQAAAAMQERRAQLQVWVNGQEMTQAEQMQLRQDQNAIAWINGQRGKTLTNQEADDAIAQRMARVNLGQQRLQAQELKLRQRQTQHVAAQTQIQNAIYDSMNQAADSKRAIVIDKDFVDEARQAAIHAGLDPTSPQGDAEMKAYALKNGRAVTGWTQKDGTIKPDVAPKAGAGGTASQAVGATHHNDSFMKALGELDKLAKEKDAEGNLVHPEFKDENARIEAAKKRAAAAHQYSQEAMGSKQEAEKKAHEAALTGLTGAQDLFQRTPNFSPQLRAFADQTVKEAQQLMRQYPPSKRTQKMADKINGLVDRIEQLKFNAEAGQQPAPAQQSPAPAEGPGIGTRLLGGLNRLAELSGEAAGF